MIRKVSVIIKKRIGGVPESEWPVEWEGIADWDGHRVALPASGIKSNCEYKLYFDWTGVQDAPRAWSSWSSLRVVRASETRRDDGE